MALTIEVWEVIS